ncbi:lysophospholipid acyltransferase family protein [Deefgea salmonis]|uniref:Lysophospholipid acyltransferase family protein n=1 Tax=Deefgea salmonis TaxID=2875502 RepID=A0ABS8BLQ5_9NEIS|nr:lysophospholipid acyltransferase family protein [Deefgea salmonis]MCB5196668.1 lysophospholipid acyltransferase family protein [Deefgea salmonis]
MQRTIFDTPIIRDVMPRLSKWLLNSLGWRLKGDFPALDKYVLIAAPHTSNWDFPIGLALCFIARQKVYWMGKHTLFVGPLGLLARWLGGISVDRRKSNSLVEQIADVYQRSERLIIAIPPEGTRQKVHRWKTGFYYIALKANIPIVLGYIDFKEKTGGCGMVFYPTGDIEADMLVIQHFYQGISGKNPQYQ